MRRIEAPPLWDQLTFFGLAVKRARPGEPVQLSLFGSRNSHAVEYADLIGRMRAGSAPR